MLNNLLNSIKKMDIYISPLLCTNSPNSLEKLNIIINDNHHNKIK